MMRRPVNLARLTPLRRGFVLGFMRAKRQSRKELRAMAADYDAEFACLQDEFRELALAHHRQCVAAATDEALLERAALNPVLH